MRDLRRVLQLFGVAVVHGLLPAISPARRRAVPGPVRLRRALEELGGTWVKLGQALALRFDLIPPAYCYELFNLLNRVGPFPYPEVRQIVRAELGRDLDDVYASFEPEPFGAASIGQVHAATLHSGERVAVKIQRPGIERLIATDISLMYRISGLVDLTRIFGGTRTRDVIDELARWTREELDYTVEAEHARLMRENTRTRETEYDPQVYTELTTRRVLTAELLDGILIADLMRDLRDDRDATLRRLTAAGYDLDAAAGNIVWNFLSQAYAVGVFHGDLHPANLMLLPGDRIGYVDFGIIGRLPEAVRQSLVLYAKNLFFGDVDAAISEFLQWVKPSSTTRVLAASEALVELTRGFLAELDAAETGRRQILARYQVDLLTATRAHRMAIDPVVVLYMKVVFTIESVTSELSPSLDLQSIHARFFGELILEGITAA
ncbi:MAG TPA: AarF/UbiB family protein [Solirubrobacteraceae bacterium]|jgi:predicted unusual protein kinase regulating ubiquinone biosynthesis (AarF/ABC1/UbiB family)|nr:AarF/UbiB family protein [Solirubrobacteraceae bacterium]